MSAAALTAYRGAWAIASHPLRLVSAQTAHTTLLRTLRWADGTPPAIGLARAVHALTMPPRETLVGGVALPGPVIVAAGLVKGDGFPDEGSALAAVERGRDVVPGWRAAPALLGVVELGSFTRWPRTGNPGTVIWRDDRSRSTQNRVGLRNPGARAAAAFLGRHAAEMPPVYGINLAPGPGAGPEAAAVELAEAAASFELALRTEGRGPAWYTLNLSCPNTEDDPEARQTDELARRLASVLVEAVPVPLWVKVGPALSHRQYEVLAVALAEAGARAIVATNTLSRPAPDGSSAAGLGGAALRPHALRALSVLADAIARRDLGLDLVACGGLMSADDLEEAFDAGARAGMAYSALVFRGPLALALMSR